MKRLFNLENLERIKICLGTNTDLRRVNKPTNPTFSFVIMDFGDEK